MVPVYTESWEQLVWDCLYSSAGYSVDNGRTGGHHPQPSAVAIDTELCPVGTRIPVPLQVSTEFAVWQLER
jgi:hypothetical protein